MIIKERGIPLRLLTIQALDRRLSLSHPKKSKVTEEKRRRKAGYNGEKALDSYLDNYLEKDYLILRDLRLSNQQSYFQIDTLLLSPNLVLLIEAKNIAGELTIDNNFNQMTQTFNQNKYVYDDPLLQVRLQHSQLTKWLQKNTACSLTIEHLVVFTNSSTLIETNAPPGYYSSLCRLNQLRDKIQDLEKLHPSMMASPRNIKSLARLLQKKHTPEQNLNIMDKYQVTNDDLIKGIQCPECQRYSMKRISASWLCPSCRHKSKNAHVQAVEDFFLLLGPYITNQQFREFLKVPSLHISSKLLASMDLPFSGQKKGRRYSYHTLPLSKKA